MWRALVLGVALLLWPALRALPEPQRERAARPMQPRPAGLWSPWRWLPLYAIGLLGIAAMYAVGLVVAAVAALLDVPAPAALGLAAGIMSGLFGIGGGTNEIQRSRCDRGSPPW